ncbi:endonuclease [Ktedonobacteria bacterium brp13]|nr:endonuclease [Ktedonobacteria bacterium brp13]
MPKSYNRDLILLAQDLRRNMTEQEKRLWYCFLRHHSLRFQRQKVIDPFIVDFYCAHAHLCIELDGDQHYTEEGLLYDAKRTRILNRYSLQVVRFSNSDVNNNFAAVCMSIDNEVKKQEHSLAENKNKQGEDKLDTGR